MNFFKKKENIECFVILQCNDCQKETKRKFEINDYIFQTTGNCSSCKGKTMISKIFGEDTNPK